MSISLQYEKDLLTAQIAPYRRYDGTTGQELLITLPNPQPFPEPMTQRLDDIFLRIGRSGTVLRIPVFMGELRYFLPDYQDYYYLPDEDMAVHKSVAAFVDRKFRKPARPANCYTRKSGQFLPQYEGIVKPEFRREYRDKISYFALPEDFCSSQELLCRYTDHVLAHMDALQ
jgi:hypothetical protein